MTVWVGAVDRGDAQRLAPALQPRAQLVGGQQHRGHRPGTGQARQRLAAQRHHFGGLGQRQHPGDVGGGDLSLGMPDHRIRHNPVSRQHLGQRHHHREQHRLDHIDAIQRRRRGVLAQDITHRPARERPQRLITLIHGARQNRGDGGRAGRPCPGTGRPGRGTRTPSCRPGGPDGGGSARGGVGRSRSAPKASSRSWRGSSLSAGAVITAR